MRDLRLYVEAIKRRLGGGEVARYLLLEANEELPPASHLRGVACVVVMAPGAGNDLDVRFAAVLADALARSVEHVTSDTRSPGDIQTSSVELPPTADSTEQRTPGKPDSHNRKDRSE